MSTEDRATIVAPMSLSAFNALVSSFSLLVRSVGL